MQGMMLVLNKSLGSCSCIFKNNEERIEVTTKRDLAGSRLGRFEWEKVLKAAKV